jgi:hypothetical protein
MTAIAKKELFVNSTRFGLFLAISHSSYKKQFVPGMEVAFSKILTLAFARYEQEH